MIIVVMGVAGCGKTTIGGCLSKALQIPFLEGDDLHPRANISKMRKGLPLTDEDRNPWLKRVAEKMVEMARQGDGVVACSALKERYRSVLRGDTSFPVLLVYLKGTRETLYRRLLQRKSHFMPPDLLDSQLKALEEPRNALALSIELSPEIICKRIVEYAVGQMGGHIGPPPRNARTNDCVGR
jgi:carbohydrate kinase (thermoresistant glucokinase family)